MPADADINKDSDLLEKIFQNTTDGIVVTDSVGNIVNVNKAVEKMLGFGKDELIGKHTAEMSLNDEESLSKIPVMVEKLQKDGFVENWEANWYRKDGSLCPIEFNIVFLHDNEGNITGSSSILRDITVRKQAEEELNKIKIYYENIMKSSLDAIVTSDNEGYVTGANKAFLDLTGYNEEEIIKMHMAEFSLYKEGRYESTSGKSVEVNRDYFENNDKNLSSLVKGCNVSNWEMFLFRKDKKIVLVDNNIFYINNDKGERTEAVGIMRDITKRKQAEEELKNSEDKYRNTLENIPDVVWTSDYKGNTILISPKIKEIYGYSPEEIYEQGTHLWFERIHPDDAEIVRRAFKSLFDNNSSYDIEYRIKKRNGEWIWLHDRSIKTYYKNGMVYADGILADITKRKQADEELIKTKNYYENIIQSSLDAIVTSDNQGYITGVNKAFLDLTGYTEEEAKRMHMSEFSLYKEGIYELASGKSVEINSDYIENNETTTSSLVKGCNVTNWEIYFRRKDKKVILVDNNIFFTTNEKGEKTEAVGIMRDITVRKHVEEERMRLISAVEQAEEIILILDLDGCIQYANPALYKILGYNIKDSIGKNPFFTERGLYSRKFYQDLLNKIKKENIWKNRFTFQRKDGSTCEIETTFSHIRDTSGKTISYVSIGRDVTNELKLERQLRHSQKIEAVGTLAGGIAHDFNNILAAIVGFTELAIYHLPGNTKAKEDLKQVLSATYRGENLVNQILAFSSRSEQEMVPVKLNHIINEAHKFLKVTLPKNTVFRMNIDITDSRVLADPTQIHQILVNLCTNAADAMADKGGVLEISLRDVNVDSANKAQFEGLSPGAYVELSVSDTGTGISQEVMKRIFDPFFTTKKVGKGTGMGLSVIHGIVKSHKGKIMVDSTPGKGTTFQIIFPKFIKAISKDLWKNKKQSNG